MSQSDSYTEVGKVEEPIPDTLKVLEYSGVSFVYEKNSVNISYNGDVKSKRNFFMDASWIFYKF